MASVLSDETIDLNDIFVTTDDGRMYEPIYTFTLKVNTYSEIAQVFLASAESNRKDVTSNSWICLKSDKFGSLHVIRLKDLFEAVNEQGEEFHKLYTDERLTMVLAQDEKAERAKIKSSAYPDK